MRALLLAVVLLTLVYLSSSAETKASASRLQSCRRTVRAKCKPNGKICVRIARSNLCQLRSYSCKQRLANCRTANSNNSLSQAFYQRVNRKLCSSNKINQSLPCASSNNNNNNSTNTPIIYA
ncbi:uncharacterized protein LOC111598002 [Drosophila hydei]|uniref:Uncharacterized protein LOC111598002 n=1 Tax=Drosophila hydei TaxID=7224 RepID=A0A6J1LTY8_DROHY|nr:uncharacterized protein LOC111598002 [Drosophila hydei]